MARSLKIIRRLSTVIIVSPCIDNVLLLVRFLFLYLISLVPPRANELIEVKEIPVTGWSSRTGSNRRHVDRRCSCKSSSSKSELCSPRGFGGMEYHAWLPERRPLLLGEPGTVRSSRRASRSPVAPSSDFSSCSALPYPSLLRSTLSIFSFSYIFSSPVSVSPFLPWFLHPLASLSSVRLESLSFSELAEREVLLNVLPSVSGT